MAISQAQDQDKLQGAGSTSQSTPPAQDLRDAEQLEKLNAQRARNSVTAANAQITATISALIHAGYVEDAMGVPLQGIIHPEAEKLRESLLQSVIQSIAPYTDPDSKTTHRIFEGTGAEASELLLGSLVGVGTDLANKIRYSMFQGELGNLLGTEMPRFRLERVLYSFKNAKTPQAENALRELLTFPYREGVSIWQALKNGLSEESESQMASDLELAREILGAVIRGRDTELAWKIRRELLDGSESSIRSIDGMTSSQAWSIRQSALKRAILSWEETKSGGSESTEVSAPKYNNDLSLLLSGIQGMDTETALKFRRDAFEKGGASPIDIYNSLTGTTSEEALALRQEMISLAIADLQNMDLISVFLAIRGDNSPEAWEIREKIFADPQKYKDEENRIKGDLVRLSLVYTIGNLTNETADAFVNKALKGGVSPNDVLLTLRGSDLKSIWEIREAMFNNLKNTDRLKDRSAAEQLEALPAGIQRTMIEKLKELWRWNGLVDMEKLSDKEVIARLKNIEAQDNENTSPGRSISTPYFMRRSEEGDSWGKDKTWYEIENAYNAQYEFLQGLSHSLSGMTSLRAAQMRQDLVKEGVAPDMLLSACAGVFTPEANTIRSNVLKQVLSNALQVSMGGYLCSELVRTLRTGPFLDPEEQINRDIYGERDHRGHFDWRNFIQGF